MHTIWWPSNLVESETFECARHYANGIVFQFGLKTLLNTCFQGMETACGRVLYTTSEACLPAQYTLDSAIRCKVSRPVAELNSRCGTSNCSRHRPACRLCQFHGYRTGTELRQPVYNTTFLYTVHHQCSFYFWKTSQALCVDGICGINC